MADAYAARLGEVIDTLCLENGKTRPEATFEASLIIRALRFAAGLATHTFGRAADTIPGRQTVLLRQPVGVAGLIIPWNSPAYLGIRALAPALAAGCTAGDEVSRTGGAQRASGRRDHGQRCGNAEGRGKHLQRIRRGRGAAAGGIAAGAGDQLYREHAYRPHDRAGSRKAPKACGTGAWREDAACHL